MRKIASAILSIFLSLLITACSNNKPPSIKKINNDSIKDIAFFNEQSVESLNNRLYMLSSDNKGTIIFYNKDIDPDSLTMDIRRETITLSVIRVMGKKIFTLMK